MPTPFQPILHYTISANSYGQTTNCYYCTAAALLNKSVKTLIDDTEIMQQDCATLNETVSLLAQAGCAVSYKSYDQATLPVLNNDLASLPINHGLGLAYTRQDNSGHMVVLVKLATGLTCIDYQNIPPKVLNFPPETNLKQLHLLYKS